MSVTLHVWRVRSRDVPAALAMVRPTARRLRRQDDVRFAKVLGTASAQFLPTAVTPRRWAAIVRWSETAGRLPVQWWDRHAEEKASLSLRPLSTRGAWDGHDPFAPADVQTWDGPVVVLTRSSLRVSRARDFYRTVPAIAGELQDAEGCRVAFGIGEAPLLRQGTVSVWSSAEAMTRFAYASPHHRAAVAATPQRRWYAEDLFTRFALVRATGSIDGVTL